MLTYMYHDDLFQFKTGNAQISKAFATTSDCPTLDNGFTWGTDALPCLSLCGPFITIYICLYVKHFELHSLYEKCYINELLPPSKAMHINSRSKIKGMTTQHNTT